MAAIKRFIASSFVIIVSFYVSRCKDTLFFLFHTNYCKKSSNFARKKRASLLTLGHRCKHHGPRLIADLQRKKLDRPEQITPLSVLYLQLHGAGTAVATVLCLYLLLCRGKAIAPDIDLTTPNMVYGLVLAVAFNIYGGGRETIWAVAARQLRRPGAQGGVEHPITMSTITMTASITIM